MCLCDGCFLLKDCFIIIIIIIIINLLGNMEPLDFKHISWFIPFQISFVFVLLIMKYSL